MNGFGPKNASIVSVCIPVLNEADHLPRLLAQLQAQRDVELDIIVADGGSTDGSICRLPPTVRVVTSARGRGAQMNAAARAARGEWLLFLHADTQIDAPRLLADAVEALALARAQLGDDRIAGHFALQFDREQGGHTLLFRYMEEKTALNRPGTINGDQGMLLTRRFFESLGGFDENRGMLEDQELAARIFDAGRWMTLPGRLITSARRFEALGPRRVYAFMALTMSAWATGNDSFLDQLPALYKRRQPDGRLDMRGVLSDWLRAHRGRLPAVARYALANAWQLPFFLNVLSRYCRRHNRATPESVRAARR
ncbi:MAG TPA: TIGR04283 family arsenosugar biosynthesis glycosyltransferase [Gammaproteobacteria bacterium]|nr:TIGR04283 family arsenosugar biosynthesis glycosyltransferase [Gammaproteobacteria bacterium]